MFIFMLHYNFFEKSVGLWRIIYWIHIILIDDLTNQKLSINKTLFIK